MKGGCLHQEEFDRVFEGFRYRTLPSGETVCELRRPKLRFLGSYRRGAFMLGGMFQGEHAKWIELAQLMVVAGHLDYRAEPDGVSYCLPGKGDTPQPERVALFAPEVVK